MWVNTSQDNLKAQESGHTNQHTPAHERSQSESRGQDHKAATPQPTPTLQRRSEKAETTGDKTMSKPKKAATPQPTPTPRRRETAQITGNKTISEPISEPKKAATPQPTPTPRRRETAETTGSRFAQCCKLIQPKLHRFTVQLWLGPTLLEEVVLDVLGVLEVVDDVDIWTKRNNCSH